MTFTLKELEYLESLKEGFREEDPDSPEEEIRYRAHRVLEVRRSKTQQDGEDASGEDEGIYLIYNDDIDDACHVVGYIQGSEEDADRYCDMYNANIEHYWDEVDYICLEKLN